jgi:hypothetical protein
MPIFASSNKPGVLAQLARALDWQSKGQGFDSLTLHGENSNDIRGFQQWEPLFRLAQNFEKYTERTLLFTNSL